MLSSKSFVLSKVSCSSQSNSSGKLIPGPILKIHSGSCRRAVESFLHPTYNKQTKHVLPEHVSI